MVTSAAHRSWPGDVAVSDLPQAGLPAPSIVRTAKIATIEAAQAEFAGRLDPADRAAVARSLSASLASSLSAACR